MEPKKYDSFSPKRATNIDGFFVKPAQNRARQPVFRSPAAKPQPVSATLADMPKRTQPQAVLGSSAVPPAQAEPAVSPEVGGRRRRKLDRAPDEPKSRKSKREKKDKEHKPRSWRRIFKRSSAIVGVLVLLGGLWIGFKFYHDIAKLTGNKNPLSLLSVFKPVALKNQDGRVNVLVAANSADDPGHNGANLTDSIMVLSIVTKKNTSYIYPHCRYLYIVI